mgnify:CR=1 FL=1
MLKRGDQKLPRRGDVYLVNFDPAIGSEIKKTRPALVIQNNIANKHSPVVIVASISSFAGDAFYPTEVVIELKEGGLDKRSLALMNQIKTIDKQRLISKLGSLKKETMLKVDSALEVSLGLIEI